MTAQNGGTSTQNCYTSTAQSTAHFKTMIWQKQNLN